MQLAPNPDHVHQTGVGAIQIWDAVEGRPSAIACKVTALRKKDRYPIATAVMHAGGVYGFLKLRTGRTYDLLIEPIGPAYLPSMRTLEVPDDFQKRAILDARLRPSSMYRRPVHSAVLRGTVQWKDTGRPARWACISGWLFPTHPPPPPPPPAQPPPPISSTWTRTDARGDFALFLRHPPPNSDGKVPAYTAFIEIHATTPPPTTDLAVDDLSDLVIDNGTDEEVLQRQPLAQAVQPLPLSRPCMPDDDLSLGLILLT